MSLAPKSKLKDKSAAKALKEQAKASVKPSTVPANGGNGAPANVYNPFSGTFHTLDAVPPGTLATITQNGRFRTIDDTEDHSGSSFVTATEFDSLSNNGSCSGESEDQRDKTASSARVEPLPGCDTDKREKIRQKNERKHQRQKERRTQELHERCNGYLMSRKLEVLAQQLVAMGFSSEQATMALILNEGRPEESVTWLFEGGLESKQQVTANIEPGASLKIDITDELAKIADLEVRFKCTRQEVERAIVACEGDLEKVEETLKVQKLEQEAFPRKAEELHDSVVASSNSNKIALDAHNSSLKVPQNGLVTASSQKPKGDDRDFNYTRSMATGAGSNESQNRNLQSLRKLQTKPDWGRPQISAITDKRWSSASPTPTVLCSLTSFQVAAPPTKSEARYLVTSNEAMANTQASALREPVVVMQRPQSVNAKQSLPVTSLSIGASPSVSMGWHSNGVSSMETLKVANSGVGHRMSDFYSNGPSGHQLLPHSHFQDYVTATMEPSAARWSRVWNSTGSAASLLSVPSSLGLFTDWTSSGSASSADWRNGAPKPHDYTSIDWSVDLSLLRPSGKSDFSSGTWSTMFMGGGTAVMPMSNGSRYMAGVQDKSMISDTSSSLGSHEWTSPFAGQDLFMTTRRSVISPSL